MPSAKPNADGSIGNCTPATPAHVVRGNRAVAQHLRPVPLGPDHSQIEIYTPIKHGIMFAAQQNMMNLKARSTV